MQDNVEALFLASDPFREGASLRLHTEVRGVERAIRRGRAHDRVKLVPCFAPRTRDLQDALMLHDPRIVHFAGPGEGHGVIYLADAYGRRGVVEKEELAKLFGILSEWIKVVILNGCDTLPMVEALGDVVDYAIGMDQPLCDASAIVFAEAFYGGLGMGKPVQAAFDLAVGRLESEGFEATAIPVLRIRPGVDPAVPLLAPAGPPAPPETARRWSRPAAR
ncbi:MAG TPA: hypothetical protein VGB92_09455 [Longimicrobium sp.]|jgi:hypothetical protein